MLGAPLLRLSPGDRASGTLSAMEISGLGNWIAQVFQAASFILSQRRQLKKNACIAQESVNHVQLTVHIFQVRSKWGAPTRAESLSKSRWTVFPLSLQRAALGRKGPPRSRCRHVESKVGPTQKGTELRLQLQGVWGRGDQGP